MLKLPLPLAPAFQQVFDRCDWNGEDRRKEVMDYLPLRLLRGPSVHLFCAAVPKDYVRPGVADDNGVKRQIQQLSLLPDFFIGKLARRYVAYHLRVAIRASVRVERG